MQSRMSVFFVAIAVLMAGVVLAQPLTVSAQGAGSEEMTNEQVVLAMTEAISAGEIEEALSYFAEDAYFIGYWMGTLEASVGHAEIRALFEELAAGDFQIVSEVVGTFGDDGILLTDTHTSGAGMPPPVQPMHLYDMYLVKDGKIQVYTYYMAAESRDALMEFMAAMAPAPITAEEIVGTWRWHAQSFRFQFRTDGTFRASTNMDDLNGETPQDIGTYTVEDGVLYLASNETSRYCPSQNAIYELSWSERDDLQLTLVEDECDMREAPSANPQPFVWDAEAP